MRAAQLGIICVIVFSYSDVGYCEPRRYDPLNMDLSSLGGSNDYYNPYPNHQIRNPQRIPGQSSPFYYETSTKRKVQETTTTPKPEEESDYPKMPELSKATKAISRGAELFSMNLFNAISNAPENSDVNFVMSPYSIWSLMTLVAEGASDQSQQQLKNVLHLPGLERLGESYADLQKLLIANSSAVGLSMNQAIFSDENGQINQNFVESIKNYYGANHLPVNFTDRMNAAKSINDYIRRETKWKIVKIVGPEDLIDTNLLLSSSIFFNGEWKYPFAVSSTKTQPFYDETGHKIADVPMMNMQNPLRFAVFENLNASFVELPYGHEDRLAMLLIYPIRNATMSQVFAHLSHTDIKQIHREVYRYDDVGDVIVALPRFKIETDIELLSPLQQLGIIDVFNRNKAKLTNMSKDPLFISKVVHKAIIEVDELGTVASAVSYANAVDFAYPLEYIFNKPFGFMITARTSHTLLFAGQVRNPLP